MVLSCKNIQKSFGVTEVLKDATFLLEDGEKAAIIGVNGAGKTTLLKIITGEVQKDSGEISLKKGAQIGYLSQMMGVSPDNTIEQELRTVFSELIRIENEMRRLESKMKSAVNGELNEMMEKYSRLSRYFEDKKGYEYESRLRGVIKGLAFSAEEAQRPISALSGGQKTRVALGKLLLTAPDVLLLDEPTNHLDIESVQWLEDVFLKSYEGGVIVVSHDRYFLDKTVTKIIEIENGKSEVYNGNYTYYLNKKESDREIELKHYADQQKEIKRQEEVIKRLKSFNREKSIKAAESKEKRLAKMERVEKPEDLPDKIWIKLEPRRRSGVDVLSVKKLKKSFDDGDLFENATFEIKRGEKAALIGANGIGKTTLLKMLLNNKGLESQVKIGTNVEVGYFDQEHHMLDDSKTIFDEISDNFPHLKIVEIRNTLAAFVFTGDDVYKTISSLSGGEKGRVALAKLMLSNANFLLLDEPTNHLDMFSKDVLEKALRSYTGTILYISHDRYFINSTADKIFELNKDGVTQYLGNYDYYAEKKAEYIDEPSSQTQEETSVKEEWKRKKDSLSEERKRQAKIERLEKEIENIETKINELDTLLSQEEVYTDALMAEKVFNEKTELECKLEELYEQWHDIQ